VFQTLKNLERLEGIFAEYISVEAISMSKRPIQFKGYEMLGVEIRVSTYHGDLVITLTQVEEFNISDEGLEDRIQKELIKLIAGEPTETEGEFND
jgi:hypothetical protein